MKDSKILPTVLLLSPFVFSFAFAMDIFIPAIPQMKEALNTTQADVQLTLSLFMLAAGLGQLWLGPASDHYGRRRVMLLSAVAFILGSGLCALANSIQILFVARIIQSFGGCGMLVVAFAIIRDKFSGNEAAKAYSFLNCGIGMSPLFAPIIGSYLLHWFNWRAGFIFLTLMAGIIIVIAIFRIKETLTPEHRSRINRSVFLRYWQICKNRAFIMYGFCSITGMIVFFVFFSTSPYIIIKLLGIAERDFGYYFFMVGLAFFLGSLVCGKIAGRMGVCFVAVTGTSLLLLAGIAMWLWYHMEGISIAQYIIPCILAGFGGSFMMGAGAAGAMEPFKKMAGSAAALLGCLQFLFAAVVGTYLMHWPINSTQLLAFTMMVTSALSLATVAVLSHKRLEVDEK